MRSPVLAGQAREAAGCLPLLTHAAKAKVMIPRPSIEDSW
jgi:hypothetical protein